MKIGSVCAGRMQIAGLAMLAASMAFGKGETIGEFFEFSRSANKIVFKCCGKEAKPFAEMSLKGFGAADIYARCEEGRPFIYVGVTPKGDVPAKLELPAILLKNQPVVRELRMQGSGGLTNLMHGMVASYMYAAVADPLTRKGVVVAWLTSEHASGIVRAEANGEDVVLRAEAQYGRALPAKVAAQKGETLVVGFFDDCRKGLEAYADEIAYHYGIRLPRQIAGYCTWYADRHGWGGDEKSTREFIDAAVKLAPYGFEFFQIDDYWQDGVRGKGPLKNFTRVDPKGPYPSGMKPTADYIRSKGFRAGLWYMPFSGVGKDPHFADKQALFVRSACDSPSTPPRRYQSRFKAGEVYTTPFGDDALDMTNPDARRYVTDLTRLIVKDWGFSYLKYDGMYTAMAVELAGSPWHVEDGMGQQVFADKEATNVEAYRLGVKALREGAGKDTFVLACNIAQNARGMGASYGLVEAMRVGGDNGPQLSRYMAGPILGTPRYFFNNRVWYNDPDPVYVRAARPIGQARLFATWTSLQNALFNFSDWLPDLPEERVEILRRTLAPHGCKNVRPVDFFDNAYARAWCLESDDIRIFGLYNWDRNTPLVFDYTAEYAGLDPLETYVGYDFWNNKFIGPFKGRLVAETPANDCRVLALRPIRDMPVLVSTSRHVASPVYDKVKTVWTGDAREGILSGTSSRLVPGERYELRVVAPAGWKCVGAEADGAKGCVLQGGTALRAAFKSQSDSLAWRLAFVKEQ